MWEPSAPNQTKPTTVTTIIPQMHGATSLLNAGMTDSLYVPFTMCKSAINYGKCFYFLLFPFYF